MKKIDLPLLLHVGYPKTATTTLQKNVFNHNYLIHLDNLIDTPYSRAIIFQNEIPFLKSLSKNRYLIKKEIEGQLGDKPDAKKVILSNENFLSNSMVFRTFPASFYFCPDPAAIARKLSLLFNTDFCEYEPKIIFTIRKQTDLLKSCYAQYFNLIYRKNRETSSFRTFISYAYEKNYDNFIGATINFNQIVSFYEELFHKNNIFIFVFEDLLQNPNKFVFLWAKLLGLPHSIVQDCLSKKENERKLPNNLYKQDTIGFLRFVGPNTYKFMQAIKKILPPFISLPISKKLQSVKIEGKEFMIDFENEKEIINRYYEDNRELDERYGLNLEKYGYY